MFREYIGLDSRCERLVDSIIDVGKGVLDS